MTGRATEPRRLALPPAFRAHLSPTAPGACADACRLAGSGLAPAGTLVWTGKADTIDLAVILAPEEPLATARRGFFAGMAALAAALGAHAPPEMAVEIAWPDTLLFDGARIGGGQLSWPEGCGEDMVPDWLVFGGMLIASKAHAGDPGLTPFSTSLDEQGFVHDDQESIVEGFARNLTKVFEMWSEDGFSAVAGRYLGHLPRGDGAGPFAIAKTGDLVESAAVGEPRRSALLPALEAVSWLDRHTKTVRL